MNDEKGWFRCFARTSIPHRHLRFTRNRADLGPGRENARQTPYRRQSAAGFYPGWANHHAMIGALRDADPATPSPTRKKTSGYITFSFLLWPGPWRGIPDPHTHDWLCQCTHEREQPAFNKQIAPGRMKVVKGAYRAGCVTFGEGGLRMHIAAISNASLFCRNFWHRPLGG